MHESHAVFSLFILLDSIKEYMTYCIQLSHSVKHSYDILYVLVKYSLIMFGYTICVYLLSLTSIVELLLFKRSLINWCLYLKVNINTWMGAGMCNASL